MSYAQWVPTAYYEVNDVVYDGSLAYQCLVANGPPAPQQPSVSPLFWAELSVADITAVLAGTGISVATPGGPTPTVTNTGVLSVDGATGAVTTKVGGWHKNSNQTITATGSPSNIPIAWNQSSYGDTTTISQIAPNGGAFTVNQNGIYSFSLQVQYANLGSATLSDTTFRLLLVLTRGGSSANVLTTTFDYPNNTPANPTHQLNGTYQLIAGDQLTFQTQQYLSAGSFTINGQAAPPTAFDYNTFFDWQLVTPLP